MILKKLMWAALSVMALSAFAFNLAITIYALSLLIF
jgi:hypothetical protein